MSSLASLRLALAIFFVAGLACDRLVARSFPHHFIPEQRMSAALASGSGCIVTAGDSRMVAGVDLEVLERTLRKAGRNECTANIAIGALPIHGISVALREYLRRGGKPEVLVLGLSEDMLIPLKDAPDPSRFVGNDAISIAWSDAADVRRLYPGFPFANVREFDDGLRFLLARQSALGSYDSLISYKVQTLQERLLGRAKATNNVFGADSDMDALAEQMQSRAQRQLANTLTLPDEIRLDPDFSEIERRVREVGARLVVVELPMPERYRTRVTESDAGRRYLAWFSKRLADRGERFVDLTHPTWLEPSVFRDFLHLNSEGARLFSADLGRALAAPP
jgi:hypothetical protein